MSKRKEQINPVFNDFMFISPKQVMLSAYMKNYRCRHNFSQTEMANVCSLYGKPQGVSFDVMEINRYENYKTIPTPRKFQVLMNTMDIDPSML